MFRDIRNGAFPTGPRIAYGPAVVPVAIAATVLSTAVSAYGAIEQSHAAAASANYNAQVAANNAKTASINQQYAVESSQAKAAAESLQGAQQSSAIKAAEASSGVDVNSGSALGTQVAQKLVNKQNVDTTINQGQWSGYGYQTQANSFTGQAGLDRASASQDNTAGLLGATGSILSGASSTAKLAALNNAPNGLSTS